MLARSFDNDARLLDLLEVAGLPDMQGPSRVVQGQERLARLFVYEDALKRCSEQICFEQ